jgi:uncharacterized membrane protein YdbT with pleckstrin-like domain
MQEITQKSSQMKGTKLGEENDEIVAVIRKHPFGLVSVLGFSILGLVVGTIVTFSFLPSLNQSGSNNIKMIVMTIFAGFAVISLLVMLVIVSIYRANKMVITDKNMMQYLQNGLFSNKVSRLSMANVEDVTAAQKGIFATMLNFGTLRIETAGEQANFFFTYCPDPNTVAKYVLEAREKFLQHEVETLQNASPQQSMANIRNSSMYR